MHQYRQLAEFVVEHTETDPRDLIFDQPMSMTSTLTIQADMKEALKAAREGSVEPPGATRIAVNVPRAGATWPTSSR